MADTVFELDRVGVDYPTPAGTVTGLHDVSLAVPRSGITVFAGPSGSGKSTLLRVLGLFERPARGTLRFDGVDTGALRHAGRRALRREHLGLVFQNPSENLLDYLSVADNLRAAAQAARRGCEPERILEQLGLGGTGEWAVPALSGGQQQRLAFGCALARGSSVILADEPTSQLDEASADLVLDTLRYLAEQDFAVLVASHDDRLVDLGTRIARLRGGRLEGVEQR
ncbi:ATP-binding cassette domain-containing protein [Amycolatopsis acidiphila]|uniref:ABC transporter ATP-binding protein n=1 Tax=Amycolatopsis acidiphila TaxID=715473 RepID=UPI0019CD809D|nr:ATP-binding cassette domain-containing protein [Amycolatopsis acidiphila]UIJ63538.1 ATP-binding cassette domain-containing protein [Amycolatopsis acidiphila]GHG68399.1 ABC transporter ATP-binding protein [Amycolatopsis acidiphila]